MRAGRVGSSRDVVPQSGRALTAAPRPSRLLRAFLIAPLAAPVGYAVALLGVGVARGRPPSATNGLELVLAVATVGLPLAYAATALVAAPAYFLLRRFGLATRPIVWVVGAGIGVVIALGIAPQLKGELFSIPFPWWAGAGLGILSAEVFWRVLTPPSAPPKSAPPGEPYA